MSQEAKLGLFVIVVLVVFFFFTINMGTFLYKGDRQPYYIEFEKIQLLETGSPVYQTGIHIGEVAGISREIIEEPTKQVLAIVHVELNEQALISENSTASIKQSNFVGNEFFIEITYGFGEPAEPGSRIKGETPYALDQVIETAVDVSTEVKKTIESFNSIIGDDALQNNIVQLIENLEDFSSDLNRLLGGEQARFQTILSNAAAASEDLRRMMATAEAFVSDLRITVKDMQSDFQRTIKNTADLTESLKGPINEDIPVIARNLRDFSAKLDSAVTRAESLMAKMEGVVDRNTGELDTAFKNVKEFTEEAKAASQKVNRLLSDIKDEGGLIGTLIYDKEMAQSAKSTVEGVSGALSGFSTFPERFSFEAELLTFIDEDRFDPNDEYLRADMGIQYDFSDNFYLFAGGNNLGADEGLELQVGYRYNSLIFHGGLIETELSGGIDWQALEFLLLGLEGIGVTDSDRARLDLYLEFLIWENLYLKGGVQDITDELYPNVGMKVRF